jgi:putative CocE/NonD family hydrolase
MTNSISQINSLPVDWQQGPYPYERAPSHTGLIEERDVLVPMRDGVNICVDIYRPDTDEPLPVLLAFAIYNKDILDPDTAEAITPQPCWTPMWLGCLEGGDTRFLTSRGYVHVIGSPRNIGKSGSGGSREWDSYDLIEWIAKQPWCDGQVGMIGISGFAAEQFHAAKQQPPSLKAIFPFDPRGAYGTLGGFRDEYPGGLLHVFRYLIGGLVAAHQNKTSPGELPIDRDALWREAMANNDYRMYSWLYNVLTLKGQNHPAFFDLMIDPYEKPGVVEEAEAAIDAISVPAYTGCGWYGISYKTHLNGAQNYFRMLNSPKKLLLGGIAHLERPFHGLHGQILKWFDHWLKGMDTGIMDEPPVHYWVEGADRWATAKSWPPENVQWTKFYLSSWERLRTEPYVEASVDTMIPPDSFVQMPPTQTQTVQKLRYVSERLPCDMLIAGPAVLELFASIDKPDTNWIIILKDIGPDNGPLSATDANRKIGDDVPERELTRGWLKASNLELDEARSEPWAPFHKLTREAARKIVPGEIEHYSIPLMATSNLFRAGHRICVEITSLDLPTGLGGTTNVEYDPYHICSSETVLHTIYHDQMRPSHLLLPVIPQD